MTETLTNEQKEILKQTVFLEDGLLDGAEGEKKSSLAEKLQQKKSQKRKKTIKRTLIISFLLLFSYFVYFLFAPFKGTIAFGICKTFLELNIPYPDTLRLSEVSFTRNGSIKIWYTHIDSFGQFRMEPFICAFKKDEKTGGSVLGEVKMGKVTLDPKAVDSFNNSIPYLVTNPPDLTLPWPLPDSLEGLKFETDKFRKPIL